MTHPRPSNCLLALDAGVRQTGWAVFPAGSEGSGQDVTTGVIGITKRHRISVQARLSYLVDGLDALVERWRPTIVVQSQPSGIHWPMPSLLLLDATLSEWADRRCIPLHSYSAQSLRSTIAGHPNVSKEELAYTVMAGLGLIGAVKSTHEWEAIAVGHYHFSRHSA